MTKFQPRDISPVLQSLRNFLLGRKHTLAVRFEPWLASRSPPPPNIPEGPSSKLSANYYVNRDARREVRPPTDLINQSAIASGDPASKKALPTPGQVFHWD